MNDQAHIQPDESETLGLGTSVCVFTNLPPLLGYTVACELMPQCYGQILEAGQIHRVNRGDQQRLATGWKVRCK